MCRIIEVVMLPEILRHIIKIFLKYLPHRLHENGFAISVESRRVLGGVAGRGLRAVTRQRQHLPKVRRRLGRQRPGSGFLQRLVNLYCAAVCRQRRGGVCRERLARTFASITVVASLAATV